MGSSTDPDAASFSSSSEVRALNFCTTVTILGVFVIFFFLGAESGEESACCK